MAETCSAGAITAVGSTMAPAIAFDRVHGADHRAIELNAGDEGQ